MVETVMVDRTESGNRFKVMTQIVQELIGSQPLSFDCEQGKMYVVGYGCDMLCRIQVGIV